MTGRGNWLTVSIRCDVVWMKGRTGVIATVSSNNKAISKANKDKTAKKDNRVSRVSKDLKAGNRVVNSRVASNPVARRMAAVSRRATETAWDQIRVPSWVVAMVGATRDSFLLRYASGFVKLRTCDANGARPATAQGSSMK